MCVSANAAHASCLTTVVFFYGCWGWVPYSEGHTGSHKGGLCLFRAHVFSVHIKGQLARACLLPVWCPGSGHNTCVQYAACCLLQVAPVKVVRAAWWNQNSCSRVSGRVERHTRNRGLLYMCGLSDVCCVAAAATKKVPTGVRLLWPGFPSGCGVCDRVGGWLLYESRSRWVA